MFLGDFLSGDHWKQTLLFYDLYIAALVLGLEMVGPFSGLVHSTQNQKSKSFYTIFSVHYHFPVCVFSESTLNKS